MAKDLSKAVSYIEDHRDDLIKLMQTMIRTKSVNPALDPASEGEGKMAQLMIKELTDLGLQVETLEAVKGRPNIVARLKGSRPGPRILFNAHLDTVNGKMEDGWVAGPFSGDIVDGFIYGRGACDHKSPLAEMLYALKALRAVGHEFAGELIFVCDSDEEEGGVQGMRKIAEHFDLSSDYALYGCTTDFFPEAKSFYSAVGDHNIIRALSGRLQMVLKVKGQSWHTLTPKLDKNALMETMKIMPELLAYVDQTNAFEDPICGTGHQRMTLSTCECGPRQSRPAEWCDISIGRRVDGTEKLEDVEADIKARITAMLKKHGVDGVVETVRGVPNIVVDEKLPLVQELAQAAEEVTGERPKVTGWPASVGISQLLATMSIPSVLFAYGVINMHHAVNERLDVENLIRTAKVYCLTFGRLLSA